METKELRIEPDYEPTDYDIRRGLYKKTII